LSTEQNKYKPLARLGLSGMSSFTSPVQSMLKGYVDQVTLIVLQLRSRL